MKKIVSLILAGLMSVSLFAIGAAADKEVGGDNGVDSFDPTQGDASINVKVNDVTHKYAVDITFSFEDLTLGNLEWNVNDMRYDLADGTNLEDTSRTITVSNRSDLPVYAYATVTDAGDKAPWLNVAVATNNNAENKLTIGKATAGITGSTDETGKGKATSANLTVNLTSTDWNAVAAYYGDKQLQDGTQTFKVATVTVVISKN